MAIKTSKQRSRERVVQALYQWLTSGEDLAIIEHQFLNQKEGKISKSFFSNLLRNIHNNITILDELIDPTINRSTEELGSVEHAVLYLGAYELKFHPEVPYRVVINESVEISKLYGAEGSYKLINASLDRLANNIRSVEIKANI
ncbi:MAG: transcription antitermination factor NusB [Gammaproteobacteria bacterium]|nr:transcription antitermination factor NusB [Gammaproteobacteria bacterium]